MTICGLHNSVPVSWPSIDSSCVLRTHDHVRSPSFQQTSHRPSLDKLSGEHTNQEVAGACLRGRNLLLSPLQLLVAHFEGYSSEGNTFRRMLWLWQSLALKLEFWVLKYKYCVSNYLPYLCSRFHSIKQDGKELLLKDQLFLVCGTV